MTLLYCFIASSCFIVLAAIQLKLRNELEYEKARRMTAERDAGYDRATAAKYSRRYDEQQERCQELKQDVDKWFGKFKEECSLRVKYQDQLDAIYSVMAKDDI